MTDTRHTAADVTPVEDGPTGKPPRTRHRRRVLVVLAAAAVVMAPLAVVLHARTDQPARPAPQGPLPPATEKITRGDLVSEIRAAGKVEFSGSREVRNQLTGIITRLPSANSVVGPGGRLYSVNNMPVFLLRGSLPAWREFEPGMEDGPDVRMLEENLVALGYTGFTVDDEFTALTQAAVKRWQKDNGLPQSGRIELGRVVFTPGSLRITSAGAQPGDPAVPGLTVLHASGSRQRIAVEVPAGDEDLAVKGAKVRIELPDGRQTGGRISSVGAEKQNKYNKTVVPANVDPDSQEALAKLRNAGVLVVLKRLEARNVLSVPVTSLLPVSGGGYALQVVQDGKVRRVKVRTGAFAGGRVEISGPGVTEGLRVGVPKL